MLPKGQRSSVMTQENSTYVPRHPRNESKPSTEEVFETNETVEEETTEDSPEHREEKKSKTQKRMDYLVAKNTATEEKLQKALEDLDLLANKQKPLDLKDKPNRSNFDSPEAYDDALIQWTEKSIESRKEQEESRKEMLKVQKEFHDFTSKGEDKYEDFTEVFDSTLAVTTTMAQTLVTLENGIDVAHYLGTNRKESKRISELSNVKSVIELNKISMELLKDSEDKEVKKAQISKAPPATKRVKANSSFQKSPEDETTAERVQRRRDEMIARNRRGR